MPVLDWIGKKAVVNHHREVPYRLLHCDKLKSAGNPDAGNLLVQGDNLEALKALLPYYGGKVKCIYIDPPYNTGNEQWIYNDNVNSPEISSWLGRVVGADLEDLSRHDKWLCMMYPRLRLLREFLTNDGVVLLSIDDNESSHARLLLNDIFGPQNFIAQLVWEKGRKNDARLFSVGHDYIFVFAKSLASLNGEVWRSPKEGVTEIAAEYHRLKATFGEDFAAISKHLAAFYARLDKKHPSKKYARAKNADARGVWRDNNISWHGGDGPRYDILHPVTKKPCKVPDDGWRFVEETMTQKITDGYVIFREDHKKSPIYKSYIYLDDPEKVEGDVIASEGQSEVLGSVFYRHTQPSNDVIKAIFGAKAFPNPKDHEILARLIRYVTGDAKDCIVLDSFAGSGSTGHAVIALNKSDDGGRRFVLVEMDEDIARDITAVRLAKVIAAPGEAKSLKPLEKHVGLRFCTLGAPLFDADGSVSPEVAFSDLAAHVFFCDTGSPIPKRADGTSPLIGTFQDRALYLLFSLASLGLPNAKAGNVLTAAMLRALPSPGPKFSGTRVVYGEGCTVPDDRLAAAGITFKQVPYQIEGI